MLKLQLFILFLIFLISNCSCDFNDVVKAATRIVKAISEGDRPGTGIEMLFRNGSDEVIQDIRNLRSELKSLSVRTAIELYELKQLLWQLPDKVEWQAKTENIESFISIVDSKLLEFLVGLEQKKFRFLKESADDFFTGTTLRLHINRKDIVPFRVSSESSNGFFTSLSRSLINAMNVQCSGGQILQTLLRFYRIMIQAETKAYFLERFYWSSMEGGIVLSGILQDLKEETQTKFSSYFHALNSSLIIVRDLPVVSCEPKDNVWMEDESYYEFNGLFKEVIFTFRRWGCINNFSCDSIFREQHQYCDVHWFHNRTGCSRQISSCSPIRAVTACISKKGKRTFEWINTQELGNQGRNFGSCPEETADEISVPPNFWNDRRSNCRCGCIEKEWRIYVGLLGSRKSDNYVIVGVRFKRRDDVLFLQPAEGKLEANGHISNFSWVPLPKVVSDNAAVTLDLDYHSFFLNHVSLNFGYVMTGIQFIRVGRRGKNKVIIKGFAVLVRGVPFNYSTGKLDLIPTEEIVSRGVQYSVEKELPYKRVHPIYTDQREPNEQSLLHHTYVTLQQSDLDHDFGQSTLPLFDIMPVTIDPPSPLVGIRIFHKGTKDHAGFISLSLLPVEYGNYLDDLITMSDSNDPQLWSDGIPATHKFL